MNQNEIGVIILAGGFGTRIKNYLGSLPKPLVNVLEKPFLYWIIKFLVHQNLNNFIITTHYQHKKIDKFVESINKEGTNISTVYEKEPLGTGGSVINAITKTKVKYKYYLILNGDSLLIENFNKLISSCLDFNTDGAIFTVFLKNAQRYGTIEYNEAGFLSGFKEKISGKGYINAGVYFFKYAFLQKFTGKVENFSLEKDFFPKIIKNGHAIKVLFSSSNFIDIGTPESLILADKFVKTSLDDVISVGD